MNDNNDDTIRHEAPTRRDYVKYGGAVIGGGLLAGCSGQSDAGEGGNTTNGSGAGSYSVTMPPVGTVEFESPPQRWVGDYGVVVDIGVALGQLDGILGTPYPPFINTDFYNKLPDVSVDTSEWDSITNEDGSLNKEFLYELDPDLITIDPNAAIAYHDAEPDTIEEITQNISPFLGNEVGKRGEGWPNYPDGEDYPYLGLHEQTRTYGQVFREEERAEALVEYHGSIIDEVTSNLPPEDERPEVGLILPLIPHTGPGDVYVYDFSEDGDNTNGKHYRDLGLTNAFAGKYGGKTNIDADFELMLEVDPEVLLFNIAFYWMDQPASDFYDDAEEGQSVLDYGREFLRNHPVASELTAVQNDEIYIGSGTSYQGPIVNLFQTELLAKQLYPEQFGEWPGLNDDGSYEIPEDEQLFDRQRVADIINGNF